MKIAGIGSRETPAAILQLMETLAADVARRGHTMKSGNAVGADQAFGRGVNSVDPGLLHLKLPWRGYNEEAIAGGNKVEIVPSEAMSAYYYDLARRYHGAWSRLRQGGRKLMARNMMIVEDVDLCICWTNPAKPWGGGTGHGVRFCIDNGIKVIDLSKKEGIAQIQELEL